MSEKRFEVSFDEKIIVDTWGVNKNTTEYDIHKSCDLINSLYEENEQLKSQRMKDAKEFSALFKQNYGLKRENEKLKRTIQKIADLDGLTVEELLESVKGVSEEDIMQYLRIFYD